MKEYIKALVKEGLGGLIKEKSKTPEKTDGKKKEAVTQNLDDKDQTSIRNNADNPMAPPKSHIMQAAGLGDPDNAGARSKFNKKLDQKDGQGFTADEMSKVSKVISKLQTGT